MGNLTQRTFNGVVWSSIMRIGVMAVTFISNVVLARILSPEDFGCIAMLMVFISLSNTFIDGGFGSALIQKKEPTQLDYSTIFYWNLALSVVLYFILYFCAPLIASFYRIELLVSVLRVQGVVLILNAFSIIQQNILRKQLRFKLMAIVRIVSASISLGIAIITALSGWGVWSLVAQQLSLSALSSLLFFFVTRWRPLVAFSPTSFRELFKFGGYILLSNLFSSLSNEIQGLLVGRFFNPTTLGYYNQAYRLESTSSTTVSSIIDQVTYPVMASLQDNLQGLRAALKRFIQILAYICCPIMMFFIVAAKPIIILLYSEKWAECVPYFQILCTAGVAVCLQGPANNAIAAIGKSNILFKWTIIKRSITITLSFLGILLAGMKGMLWCCVAGCWTVYFINSFLVSKYIGYSIYQQILDILPFVFLSFVIGIGVLFITSFLNTNMYVVTIIQFILIFLLYIGCSHLFKFESQSFIIKMICEHKSKR